LLCPFVACADDLRFCDIDRSPFERGGGLGLADEFKERDKQLLLRGGIEIGLAFPQLQLGFAVLDFESKLDSIEIRFDTGILAQGTLDRASHALGEAVANLLCYDLCRTRFAALPGASLLPARTAKAALIDELQRSDLGVT
jgi:hypothetical protein